MGKKRKGGKATAFEKAESSPAAANASSSNAKPPPFFESFPLHLLENKKYKPSKSTVQELVPGRVLVLPNFFTRDECDKWVRFCEDSQALEYTAHPATPYVAHRECFRMQQENASVLARRIFERIRDSSSTLLATIQKETNIVYRNKSNDNYQPIGCNPNLRVYKYEKGHSFGKHVDGSNLVPEMEGKTEWTLLVYLSECQGGATRFYFSDDMDEALMKRKRNKKNQSSVAYAPQVGSLLLHLHGDYCLEHEADAVLGGTKYVLRTDLVFG